MQVYQGRLTVDGLVESMMACRQGSPRDRQLFQAVLNVIYEEFQFLHNFPDKELQMTAQVLASLVSTRSSPAPCNCVAMGWTASSTFVSSLISPYVCFHAVRSQSCAYLYSASLHGGLPHPSRTLCLCTQELCKTC